jgi:HK97 gp10 family phage protein
MPSEKIVGFDELAKKLQTLSDPKEIGKVLKAVVTEAMRDTKKTAEALIPTGIDPHKTYKGRLVTPGFAKRSIRVVSRLDKKRGAAYAVLGVLAEAFYAVQFVELGTSKMVAQPWLRPAFAASKDPNIRKIAEGMREWIVGIARKHSTGVYGGGAGRAEQLLNTLEDGDT